MLLLFEGLHSASLGIISTDISKQASPSTHMAVANRCMPSSIHTLSGEATPQPTQRNNEGRLDYWC